MVKLSLLKTKIKERLDAIWDARWSGIVLTGLATAFTAVSMRSLPVPGFSAACMGLAAAVVSLRSKATGTEKATWMLIISALLVIELLAIRKDRSETYLAQLNALREEREHFSEVGRGIESVVTQSQSQFKVTLEKSDRVIGLQTKELGGLSDNLKTFTGGQSFAVFAYVPGQQFLAFAHAGKYPLYDVSARIADLDQVGKTGDPLGVTVAVGDMIQEHVKILPVPANVASSGNKFNANVFFTARNGDWVELLRQVKVGDGWLRAIRVQGQFTSLKKEKALCETIDPKFPKNAEGKIDGFDAPSGPKPPPCQ